LTYDTFYSNFDLNILSKELRKYSNTMKQDAIFRTYSGKIQQRMIGVKIQKSLLGEILLNKDFQ
jgi:hypothetical protein